MLSHAAYLNCNSLIAPRSSCQVRKPAATAPNSHVHFDGSLTISLLYTLIKKGEKGTRCVGHYGVPFEGISHGLVGRESEIASRFLCLGKVEVHGCIFRVLYLLHQLAVIRSQYPFTTNAPYRKLILLTMSALPEPCYC